MKKHIQTERIPDNFKGIIAPIHRCLKCNYKWIGRTESPKKCPSCTNRRWRES